MAAKKLEDQRRLSSAQTEITARDAANTHEDDLCLVEFLLDAHDGVGLFRVLVLLQVGGQVGIVDQDLLARLPPLPRLVLPLLLADLGRELVEQLVEQREGDPDGVLLVGDDDAGELVGRAVVRVRRVVVLLDRLPLAGLCPLGDRPREKVEKLADPVVVVGVSVTVQEESLGCSRMTVDQPVGEPESSERCPKSILTPADASCAAACP